MRAFWDVITVAIVLAGAAGFFYTWFRLMRSYAERSLRWRDWISLAAIIPVSVAIVLRFVMPAFWGHDFGDQVRFADKWAAGSVIICAAGLLASFLGRPRLIVPIAVACFGVPVFWIMSTIP